MLTIPLLPSNGYNPPITTYLKQIGENSFSYNYYKLRHPGGLYNLTTARLIDSISQLNDKLHGTESADIYNYFRLVLYDLFKFYDSCYEVMLSFCKQHTSTPRGAFVHEWIKERGYTVGKNFYDGLKGDDAFVFLRNLYNALKHTGNELRFCTIDNGSRKTVGYWLQGGTGNSGVGILGDDYPISINYELRRIYYLIYRISDELIGTLLPHIKEHWNIDLALSTDKIDDTQFSNLHKIMSNISDFFLPPEAGKSVIKSRIIKPNQFENLEFFSENIDGQLLHDTFYEGVKGFSYVDSGDGFTRTFTLPHFGFPPEDDNITTRVNGQIIPQSK